ncbi:MAG: hypothetical protein KC646_06270 [Candidatus Cloacimonetes bacterium]|nr:hypothetical protein [Candidatus Cloacimonadota bacterium]
MGLLQSADQSSSSILSNDAFMNNIDDVGPADSVDPLFMNIQTTLNTSAPSAQSLSSPQPVWASDPVFAEPSFKEPTLESFDLPKDTIVPPPPVVKKEKVTKINTPIQKPVPSKSRILKSPSSRPLDGAMNEPTLPIAKKLRSNPNDMPPGFGSFRNNRKKKKVARDNQKPFHALKGVTQMTDSILLNFVDTELGVILKTLSDFLEKTFILSPKVKSKITVINPNELNKEEAFEVLLSILELSDFGVIEKGSVVKIFPKQDAKNFMTSLEEDPNKGDNSLITRIIEVKYLTPEKVSQLLKQFVNKDTEQISLDTLGSKIIISGFKSHVERFEELLKKLDKDYLLVFKPHFIRLKYGNADSLIEGIQQFYSLDGGASSGGGGPTSARFGASKSSAKDMSNIKSMFSLNNGDTLVVLAHPREIERVKELVEFLDRPKNEKRKFYEIQLEKARVHTVLNMLVDFLEEKETGKSGGIPGRASNSEISKITKENFIILEDVKQNKLIVYSNYYYHKQIESYVKLLDKNSFGDAIVKYFPLYHITPKDISQKLNKIYLDEVKNNSSIRLKIIPDEKLNGLVVSALSRKTINDIENIIAQFDKEESHLLVEEQIYVLDNANSKNVGEVLKSFYTKDGSSGSNVKIVADEETNSILVSAIPQLLHKIEEMIIQLDKESSQVLVEVLIVEALLDKSKDFGIEWQLTEGNNTHATNFGIENSTSTGSDLFSQLSGFKQSILDPGRFKGIVHALNSRENVKIVATPRLWASNKKEASFLIGDKFPIKTSESQNTVGTVNSFSYQDVGIKLVLTPNITKNKNITLEIAQEIKTLRAIGASDTGGNPIIQTREVKTTATVEDKHTIVLGGLIREDSNKTVNGVPVLSKLPVLGNLFKKKTDTTLKTEMLIFFTPTIVSKRGVKEISNINLKDFSKLMK